MIQKVDGNSSKRDLTRLTKKSYDVIIIGGGIYGACVAWDATLRGLSVVLVDKGDFGAATSANSHKIIHGGLRYLQHGDFRRMRESIRERRALMHIAPHLVHPLPFLIPTYGYGLRSKWVMGVAMGVNDLVSFDRNYKMDPQKHLPRGQIVSKEECVRLVPGLDHPGMTGGARWVDGQVHHAERLTLSFLMSAVEKGAEVANYAEAIGFLGERGHIQGIRICDGLTQRTFEISSKIVVNTSGPWINEILGLLDTKQPEEFRFCKAFVLVTRQLQPDLAFGVFGKQPHRDADAVLNKASRLFFIAPWRNTSLVGTFYISADVRISGKEIENFLNEINDAYPHAALKQEDVYDVYQGLLPISAMDPTTGDFRFTKAYQIKNHSESNEVEGLVSVAGVKYTTARDVAEKTTNLVLEKLKQPAIACRTAEIPLVGGQIEHFEDFLSEAIEKKPNELSTETITHLVYHYGANYLKILDDIEAQPELGQQICADPLVLKAEIAHAIREEMALNLSDVVFHRTVLGSNGVPQETCLQACAYFMADELGWDETRIQQQINTAKNYRNLAI